ncbi:unnamed protein product [Auanema sp. JU1783]|nr:unnamed protein product [Auanema sp. JU1783]
MKFLLLLLFCLQHYLSYAYTLSNWKDIHEDVEVPTDVSPDEQQRFHIRRSNRSSEVFLHITPCGGTVHWRLYSLKCDFAEIEHLYAFTDSPDVQLVAGEADDQRMKFYSKNLPYDDLLLVVTAPALVSVNIFVSTSMDKINDFYPPLPHDTRVVYAIEQENDAEKKQALINWKISDSIRYASDPSRYRICAVVSKRHPDWAACDLLDEGLESIHCVPNNNNSMIIDNLRAGRRYYILLFVRDMLRGTTSSYEALEINFRKSRDTPVKHPKKDEVRLLMDSTLQTAILPPKKDSSLNFFYAVPYETPRIQRVLLIAHACNGPVRITIFRNGRMLKKTEPFSGYRRFLVMNLRIAGQLRFEVSNDDSEPKSVRLWASTRADKSPYPNLPDDTSIKIVRRTCRSATLQWLRAADKKAEYCIYRRKENAHYLEHLVSRVDNLCEGGLTSELVGCYHHKGPKSKDIKDILGVIETTITGLEPQSTYRFDLLATPLRRRGGQSLPYRTVWVRTSEC